MLIPERIMRLLITMVIVVGVMEFHQRLLKLAPENGTTFQGEQPLEA